MEEKQQQDSATGRKGASSAIVFAEVRASAPSEEAARAALARVYNLVRQASARTPATSSAPQNLGLASPDLRGSIEENKRGCARLAT